MLIDKIANIRTVINKIDDVGSTNPYRTFAYELLAGDPDLNVEINEEGCTFRFDYSKVYWNSRLNTEHRRLVEMFNPGEAICDVMAGVGPFAMPAGKKRCWVMANDLNPDSFVSLQDAVKRNKVCSSRWKATFSLSLFRLINLSSLQIKMVTPLSSHQRRRYSISISTST